MLNLRNTYDQRNIRNFGSANYPHIFPTTTIHKLPVPTSADPHLHILPPAEHQFDEHRLMYKGGWSSGLLCHIQYQVNGMLIATILSGWGGHWEA